MKENSPEKRVNKEIESERTSQGEREQILVYKASSPEDDIIYIPYDKEKDTGGHISHRNGKGVSTEVVVALGQLGLIG